MNALLSAPAGVAILIEGAEYSSIHADAPRQRIPRRAEEIHRLRGEASDLQLLQDVDLEPIAQLLEEETEATEALQLALILLDSEISSPVRREAAEELEEILKVAGLGGRLEGVLYAHPLPPEADLATAIDLAGETAPKAHELLRDLGSLQPVIREIRHAWDDLPDETFESAAGRRRLQAAMVRAGLFRALVLASLPGAAAESLAETAFARVDDAISAVDGYDRAILSWVMRLPQRQATRWARASEVAEGPVPSPKPSGGRDGSM